MLKTMKEYCTYESHEKTFFYIGTIFVNLFVSFVVSIGISLFYTFPIIRMLFEESILSIVVQKALQIHILVAIIFSLLDNLIFSPLSKKRFLKTV